MDWLKSSILIIGAALIFAFAPKAEAAVISIDAPQQNLAVGDTVAVTVHLDTQGETINAVDLGVLYPKLFSVQKISKVGSAVELWVNEPSFTKDAVFLTGGTPSGVKSKDAVVATIYLTADAAGQGTLGLSPASQVLLGDGKGTPAQVSLRTLSFTISPRPGKQTSQTYGGVALNRQNAADTTSPEGFDLLIEKQAELFDGKYFAAFSTRDSGSGVDHYEIKQGSGEYVNAQSPYVLEDQSLHSVIRVRAYDAAGNYRIETYPNIFKRFWWWITNLFRRPGA